MVVGSANVCLDWEPPVTSDAQTTTRAADLAEWIVDRISEADQDWAAIELRARELVELLARLTAPGETGGSVALGQIPEGQEHVPQTRAGRGGATRARAARTAALRAASS
jgi:hypothetical protein